MNKRVKLLADENEREEKKIAEESQEIYTDMIVYLRVSRLPDYSQELVRKDIITMILDGQERGESLEQTIGGDYKAFCDEIISAFPPKPLKDKVLDMLDMTAMCLYILGAISVVFNLIENILLKNDILTYSLSAADVLNFIVIVIIANLAVYLICKGAFDRPEKESKKKDFIKAFLSVMAFIGIFVGGRLLLDDFVVRVNMIIAIICIAAAFIFHKVMESRVLA